ncbi:uncharacterized protein LOC114740789 isoform X2 [Neltuma alba]|uniref:uncharacterized protein LOC114740789 isoform X2 n=1 Tax=Neltuma alba TaxID=207710 RepID=UPI0010A3DADE|nr:uncharacterized protein LOC114740789 isoform X2 [Prosopis alba]
MSKDPISSFCSTLASFCNHLQSSCDALKESLDRRPIPLDSASSTFVQCLNRRISSASSDLELLDSMSFGTVSFEELLGHCNELYKKNQSDLFELEESLRGYGYNPIPDIDDEDEIHDISRSNELSGSEDGLHNLSSISGNLSREDCRFKSLGEDALLDESLSLKKLGLSDACLATLACEANGTSKEVKIMTEGQELKSVSSEERMCLSHEAKTRNKESAEAPCPELKIMKNEFESLPGYMKGLASWEDLLAAVDKINSSLNKKTKGCSFFRQDEIPSFNLGPKARSYLLLLVRMNRLIVETIDGVLSYRVL